LTKDGDPIFRIDACPGAPACASAATATRSAAHRLAAQLPALGIRSAHISGCPKGCARSAPADLVLVAGKQTFGVVRNGRADDTPEAQVSWTLDDLPARLRELSHG
jgi:precorrin-3B synthase